MLNVTHIKAAIKESKSDSDKFLLELLEVTFEGYFLEKIAKINKQANYFRNVAYLVTGTTILVLAVTPLLIWIFSDYKGIPILFSVLATILVILNYTLDYKYKWKQLLLLLEDQNDALSVALIDISSIMNSELNNNEKIWRYNEISKTLVNSFAYTKALLKKPPQFHLYDLKTNELKTTENEQPKRGQNQNEIKENKNDLNNNPEKKIENIKQGENISPSKGSRMRF